MIKAISEKLNVNEKDLIRIVNTQRVNPEYKANTNTDLDERIIFNNQVEKAQIELLKLLANNNNEIRHYVLEHVTIGLIKAPLLKKLADILFDKNLNVESSAIIEYFQDKNERDSVAQILFAEDENISFEEIVSDCLKILKSEPLKEKIFTLRGQIREKESKGENILEELSAITKLREELNDL